MIFDKRYSFLDVNELKKKKQRSERNSFSGETHFGDFTWENPLKFIKSSSRGIHGERALLMPNVSKVRGGRDSPVPFPCFINANWESASLWSLPRAYPTLSASLLAVWLFAWLSIATAAEYEDFFFTWKNEKKNGKSYFFHTETVSGIKLKMGNVKCEDTNELMYLLSGFVWFSVA